MQKLSTKIIIFIVLILAAILVNQAYSTWKSAEKVAVISCFASIAAEVEKAKALKQFELNSVTRELSDSEIEQILDGSKNLDCNSVSIKSGEIRVAVGEVNRVRKELKIRVWTNGDDNVPSTFDDVIFPYEENVP